MIDIPEFAPIRVLFVTAKPIRGCCPHDSLRRLAPVLILSKSELPEKELEPEKGGTEIAPLSHKGKTGHGWLRRTGVYDKTLAIHDGLGCPAMFILFVGAVALVWLLKNPWIIIPSAVLIAILIQLYRSKIFYRDIRCPKCGYNPTRRKSDGEPRKDYDKVLHQLERYEECPNCGDRGSNI